MTAEDRLGGEAPEAAPLPDAPEPPARRRRRTFGALLVAAAAIAVAALAAHIYWQRGARDDGRGVPLLRAEPGPARERPSDPGGMTVPWRDLLALHELGAPEDETGEPVVERLLPPPEEPLPRPRPRRADPPPPPPASASNTGDSGGAGETPDSADAPIVVEIEAPEISVTALPADAGETPALPDAPILVETGAIGEAPEAPPAPIVVETAADADTDAEAPETPEAPAPIVAEADAGADGDAAAEAPPAPAPKPEPPRRQEAAAAEARPPPQTMEDILALAAETGDAVFEAGFAVQLGAYRTEAEAEQAWDNAFERAPEVLGPAPHYIAQADLGAGAGVVHRLRIGPLPGRESAETLCRDLRSAEIACFTVAP